MSGRRALVLGGGGLAGIAWQTGVLHGLHGEGIDVAGADLVVGTSAGATVAIQLGSEVPLATWFERQVEPAVQNAEMRPPGLSTAELFTTMLRLLEEYPDPSERRRQVSALALAADTVPEPVRRAVVAGRLSGCGWPSPATSIVAVDTASGERKVFDAASGVDVVDAVAASSAVPGVWPPVTIGDTRYVDGGVYSSGNVDLALGCDSVLVLAPMADGELAGQVEAVGAAGRVEVIGPDDAARAAFGVDPLDPEVRLPAARAGLDQGKHSAAVVEALWSQ